MWAFNMKVKPIHLPSHDSGFLYVGNHMGFIDILALASLKPFLFVTSQEMRETPLLGLLCEMGGCLFVERRRRTNIKNELSEMTEALKRGYRLVIYPEATSHNGEVVLPFKRTLVTSAGHAGVPIVPGVFNFTRINQDGFTMKWRDYVCWYGDMTFADAMLRLLTLDSLEASIEFLPEVRVDEQVDRGQLADSLHNEIAKRFVPVQL